MIDHEKMVLDKWEENGLCPIIASHCDVNTSTHPHLHTIGSVFP